MKTHDNEFANRPVLTAANVFFYGYTDVSFAPNSEYWRQVRKLFVQELLNAKRILSFKYVREEEMALVIENISRSCSSQTPVNLSETVLTFTNNLVCRCSISTKNEEGNSRFGEISRDVVTLMSTFSFQDFFPVLGWIDSLTGLREKVRNVYQEIDTYFEKVIEEHISKSQQDDSKKDFLDLLLHGQVEHKISRDNIKALLMMVSIEKSKIFLAHIPNSRRSEVLDMFGFREGGFLNTYLGIPLVQGRVTKKCKMSKASVVKSCMWILPNVNEIKLCWDGSALGNPGPSGIGIVYRDWEGRVLGMFCKSVGTTTNYLAEVNAIIDGVEKLYIEDGITCGWFRTPRQQSMLSSLIKYHRKLELSGHKYSILCNQSGLAQPGKRQTFRQIPWLKEDPAKTYLLRNGLREDRYSLQGLKTPT
ncbi:hypothetical protein GIB67_032925 [Kingdonia uniflora]|uniref:RNase H type-1 domain-containing protein n=1 Tax=Kingdonia uniflora TaxID=39325 RepID=A0A7J7MY26_9MAGN|nr:hypothetical protein GIB67_032925 [Kingdonia uniflora]